MQPRPRAWGVNGGGDDCLTFISSVNKGGPDTGSLGPPEEMVSGQVKDQLLWGHPEHNELRHRGRQWERDQKMGLGRLPTHIQDSNELEEDRCVCVCACVSRDEEGRDKAWGA